MEPIDVRRLAAEVSVQHGIRIDPDDPMMAVVTLNRLVLERALSTAADLVQNATAEFNRSAERVQVRAGSVIGEEVRAAVFTLRTEMQKDIDNARLKACELIGELHRADSRSRKGASIAISLATGTALFLAGVLTGIMLR